MRRARERLSERACIYFTCDIVRYLHIYITHMYMIHAVDAGMQHVRQSRENRYAHPTQIWPHSWTAFAFLAAVLAASPCAPRCHRHHHHHHARVRYCS